MVIRLFDDRNHYLTEMTFIPLWSQNRKNGTEKFTHLWHYLNAMVCSHEHYCAGTIPGL